MYVCMNLCTLRCVQFVWENVFVFEYKIYVKHLNKIKFLGEKTTNQRAKELMPTHTVSDKT